MAAKEFSNEDLYTMVTFVLLHPESKHKGTNFWKTMLDAYGSDLLKDRTAESLRSKWKKIHKQHKGGLEEYKKELSRAVSKKFVDTLDNQINTKLIAALPKPVECRPAKASKENEDLGSTSIETLAAEDKKEIRSDMNEIFSQGFNYVSRLSEIMPMSERSSAREKDLCISSVSPEDEELFPLFRKIETQLKDLSNKYNKPVERLIETLDKVSGNFHELEKHLKGENVILWEEIEDVALNRQQSQEMQNRLIESKGIEAINKRMKFLDILQ
eukprot:TRINITY_DN4571_c0_g1_i1.p1 TRINITY_DN4571_c0_g1~~TRINITY_DN4571_c0_g1_i1.p1  ORF type:complete len:271 (-),score=48.06 TRINITY_DN4571_c0_g1_i1:125-937(-)